MWIVKLGGSWLLNPRLNELLDYLSNFKNAPISIVVGGGLFAQTIRDSQKVINFSDNLGHHLALLSTENFARILNNINPSYELTSNYRRIYSKRKIQVWLPSKQLTNDLSFSKDWESTSDSIASWLCKKINAKGVIFIKSIKFKKNLELKAKTLQRKGLSTHGWT